MNMNLSQLISAVALQSRGRGMLGLVALVVLLLSGIILASTIRPLLETSRVPAGVAVAPEPEEKMKEKERAFSRTLASAVDRSIGRSPFFPPKPKIPPAPPAPARYGGPALIAMVNGAAWFADGQRLARGDKGSDGLEIVELFEPWSAKVRWQGGEFMVSLFEREPTNLAAGIGDSGSAIGLNSSSVLSSSSVTPTGFSSGSSGQRPRGSDVRGGPGGGGNRSGGGSTVPGNAGGGRGGRQGGGNGASLAGQGVVAADGRAALPDGVKVMQLGDGQGQMVIRGIDGGALMLPDGASVQVTSIQVNPDGSQVVTTVGGPGSAPIQGGDVIGNVIVVPVQSSPTGGAQPSSGPPTPQTGNQPSQSGNQPGRTNQPPALPPRSSNPR